MNDTKLFVLLVAVGFSFALLLSFVPWDQYGACFQKGMMPDIASTEQKCIELSTPRVFGISESTLNHNINPLSNNLAPALH